jgi:hypothetical protein
MFHFVAGSSFTRPALALLLLTADRLQRVVEWHARLSNHSEHVVGIVS